MGISVSRRVIRRLLGKQGLGRRKLSRNLTAKSVEGRSEQFDKINQLVRWYKGHKYPVLSIDVKKKELMGAFFRQGTCFSQVPRKANDHDFASLSTGKIVPQGIFEIGTGRAFISLGTSGDTAEFTYQCLLDWWNKVGIHHYEIGVPWLILADGGGANGSRNRHFKLALQKLVNQTGCPVRVCHYPPYCSKYNPIEHQLFPHITRSWSGVMLDSVQTALELIKERCANLKCQLKITTNQVDGIFEKGKTLKKDCLDYINWMPDKLLSKWNYRILLQLPNR